eukprot:6456609-Amphidinium_carterae.2
MSQHSLHSSSIVNMQTERLGKQRESENAPKANQNQHQTNRQSRKNPNEHPNETECKRISIQENPNQQPMK